MACPLHDVARAPEVDDGTREHEQVAVPWPAPRFGERVARLAGAQVAAKQHLVAHDPAHELRGEPPLPGRSGPTAFGATLAEQVHEVTDDAGPVRVVPEDGPGTHRYRPRVTLAARHLASPEPNEPRALSA